MTVKRAYLSLGSNVGERDRNLERALALLDREQIRVVTRSSLYETEPQDVAGQPWFLNIAAALKLLASTTTGQLPLRGQAPARASAVDNRHEQHDLPTHRLHHVGGLQHRYAAAHDPASTHAREALRARAAA